MYSDRQRELSVVLRQLQQSVEEMTGERVTIHSVTKADGEKILELVIGENPLFAPVICVEASGISYKRTALVKYYKGYLAEIEEMNDSQYYFYNNQIVERHDYTFEGKEYVASDGTSICFSVGSSWVNYEDITDVGERIVDVYYQGGIQIYLIWSDDNHFVVQGTGEYLPDLYGMSFYYEENRLYGY